MFSIRSFPVLYIPKEQTVLHAPLTVETFLAFARAHVYVIIPSFLAQLLRRRCQYCETPSPPTYTYRRPFLRAQSFRTVRRVLDAPIRADQWVRLYIYTGTTVENGKIYEFLYCVDVRSIIIILFFAPNNNAERELPPELFFL